MRVPLPGLLIPSEVQPQGVYTRESAFTPPDPYSFITASGMSLGLSPGPGLDPSLREFGSVLKVSEFMEKPKL